MPNQEFPMPRYRCSRLLALLGLAALPTLAASAKPTVPPKPAVCHAGESSFFRDEALSVKATTKLQFTKALLREKIHVKVSGGVATLSGNVSAPEHIASAAHIVSQIDGIHCVSNFLQVGPPEPADTNGPRN
jgi:hypothetical protein